MARSASNAHEGRGQFDLSYESTYRDPPRGYDMQFRKICPDAVGELADISVPDGWILYNGKPVYDEAPGRNVAVVRTDRGQRLLADAVATTTSSSLWSR